MGYRTMPYRTDLVGPVVRFRGQQLPVPQTPPHDTCDGERWAQCTDHHLACDCREAELAENYSELRHDFNAVSTALRAAIADHPTLVKTRGGNRRRDLECRCTACHVVRPLAGTSAVSRFDNIIQF